MYLLDAASNGVAGVMATIHSVSARGVFDRLVQMVRMANPPLPADFALMASTSLDLIVHVTRDRDHERFVSEVVQVHTGQLDETGLPVHRDAVPARPGRAGGPHRPQTRRRAGPAPGRRRVRPELAHPRHLHLATMLPDRHRVTARGWAS